MSQKNLENPKSTYLLSNGVNIPCIGYGTWQMANGNEAKKSVLEALKVGYNHIDTAQMYGNEESVGNAVKESGLNRKDIFITTKLSNTEHGYEKTQKAFQESLEKLQTDYIDLFLIHWPNPIRFRDSWQETNAGSWRAMEELHEQGKLRCLGVSNFYERHIDELMKTAKIAPAVNQIRLCPGDTHNELVDYCKNNNILLEAYSPLGQGKIFQVEQMQELALKYNRTIGQICIRWSLQNGFLPLPKSVTPSRILENTKVFDFELESLDVKLIADMKGVVGYSWNPDQVDW